jgi:hypothetical protein
MKVPGGNGEGLALDIFFQSENGKRGKNPVILKTT